jgi:hypothetical protein
MILATTAAAPVAMPSGIVATRSGPLRPTGRARTQMPNSTRKPVGSRAGGASIASSDRWLKTVACWRKSRFFGLDRIARGLHLLLAAYTRARMPELRVAEAG